MRSRDLAVAAAFFVLGWCLVASAARFPPGVGGLPGPGFFPGLVGAAMMALAVALASSRLRRGQPAAPARFGKPAASYAPFLTALALTALYLGLWGRIPFALRTAVFVAVFLRSQAQPWRSSIQTAAVLTAAVMVAFQYGLRVDLP